MESNLAEPLERSLDEQPVMVIRLAAVEGDQFSSSNSDTGGGTGVNHHHHQIYENNPGPTDLSTAANIQ